MRAVIAIDDQLTELQIRNRVVAGLFAQSRITPRRVPVLTIGTQRLPPQAFTQMTRKSNCHTSSHEAVQVKANDAKKGCPGIGSQYQAARKLQSIDVSMCKAHQLLSLPKSIRAHVNSDVGISQITKNLRGKISIAAYRRSDAWRRNTCLRSRMIEVNETNP